MKLKIIYSWFDAAATEEELQYMKSKERETGKVRVMADMLDGVVRQRLAYEYKDRTGDIPVSLRAGKVLLYTTIERCVNKLKGLEDNKVVHMTPQNADLFVFRKVCSPLRAAGSPGGRGQCIE